jgi:hypothetical protein
MRKPGGCSTPLQDTVALCSLVGTLRGERMYRHCSFIHPRGGAVTIIHFALQPSYCKACLETLLHKLSSSSSASSSSSSTFPSSTFSLFLLSRLLPSQVPSPPSPPASEGPPADCLQRQPFCCGLQPLPLPIIIGFVFCRRREGGS